MGLMEDAMLYEDAMCDSPCGREPMGCNHCYPDQYHVVYDEEDLHCDDRDHDFD